MPNKYGMRNGDWALGIGHWEETRGQGKISPLSSPAPPASPAPDLLTPPDPTCVTIENCNKKNIVKVI